VATVEFYFFRSLGGGTRGKQERMAREDLTRE